MREHLVGVDGWIALTVAMGQRSCGRNTENKTKENRKKNKKAGGRERGAGRMCCLSILGFLLFWILQDPCTTPATLS